MLNKKEIGNRLAEFAKSKGWTQIEFARLLGMSPQTLTPYLTGKIRPGDKQLPKLEELGCDIKWLLFGDEATEETVQPLSPELVTNSINEKNTTMFSRGERLELFIKQNFGTKREFCTKLGIDDRAIARYVGSGKKSTFGKEYQAKLSALGLNLDWYLTGNGEMLKNPKVDSEEALNVQLSNCHSENVVLKKRIETLEIQMESQSKLIEMIQSENRKTIELIQAENRKTIEAIIRNLSMSSEAMRASEIEDKVLV